MGLRASIVLIVIGSFIAHAPVLLAEGNEGLFEAQIPMARGSGYVVAGTGLENEPGMLDIEVPASATIAQVLLYWTGSEIAPVSIADSIDLDGVTVTGRPISDPLYFFNCSDCGPGLDGDHYYTTYRADITDLELVSPGTNAFSVVSSIGAFRTGAGMIVIYDDGTPVADVQVVDGTDLAYDGFDGDREVTIERSFKFESAPSARSGKLSAFVGNVNNPSNTIRITIGGAVTEIDGALDSSDGALWDTFSTEITVPAGVGEVRVQMIDSGGSLIWVNSTLRLDGGSRVDGRSEYLGLSSLTPASGSGLVSAGTGLVSQPGTIVVDVPGSVAQAILYWSGAMVGDLSGDETIEVNGVEVIGSRVGDPTFAFPCTPCGPATGDFYFSSYRADITDLDLIGAGLNTLDLEMDFSAQNSGASIVVIYDDGGPAVDVHLRDGLDVAIGGFPDVRGDTVRQYLDFPASEEPREGRVDLIVGSANNGLDVIEITVEGSTTVYENLLSGVDGAIWDTLTLPVTVAAGVECVAIKIATPAGATAIDDIVWVAGMISLESVGAPAGVGGTISVTPESTFIGGYAEVTITPTDESGELLGAGLDVVVSASGLLLGGVVDNGDGSYTQHLGANVLGTDTITATIDGEALSNSTTLEVETPPSSIFAIREDGLILSYVSIGQALERAVADATTKIYVSPGFYAERVWAWNLANLTIEALSAESPVQMYGFNVVCCHDMAIRGFDISSSWWWDGIRFRGGWASSHQVLVDRCSIEDLGDGITIRGGNTDIVIRDCDLIGNTLSGIFAWGRGPYCVVGCDLSENGLSGIDAGFRRTKITMVENTINDNGWICPGYGWGIYRYTFGSGGARRITLIDNELSGNLGSVMPGQSDVDVYRYDQWIDETDQQVPYTP